MPSFLCIMDGEDNVKWLERTIRGVPKYIILLFIFITILIGLLILIGVIIIGEYQIEVKEGYEIFRDILIFILTIAGVCIAAGGYGIYLLINKSIENRIKKREEEFSAYSTAMLFTNMGYTYWENYDILSSDKKYLQYLKAAINITERAHSHARILNEKDPRNEVLKCEILNNLVYYLAVRGNAEDREIAMQGAEFVKKRIEKYPKKSKSWQDTYDYVKSVYTNSP